MGEFQEFIKIGRYDQPVTVTEKIHGTSGQIFITEDSAKQYTVHAGSRNRWLTPQDDNYGFAAWVESNRDALTHALGPGRHFGEWYGQGINSGYGLKERRFALFNTHRWTPVLNEGGLPERVDVVPVLYEGPFSPQAVEDSMKRLREEGSVLVPGYAHPEGIVIRFNRSEMMLKAVFQAEEVAWKGQKSERPPTDHAAQLELCAPYWQPMRLEKLLSRDETFTRNYPASLPSLCAAYVADLTSETEVDAETLKLVKRHLFPAVKGMMAERGYSA